MCGLEQRARGQHDGEDMMQVVEGDADPRAEPMPVGGLADAGLDVQARAAEAEPWGRRADGKQKNMVGRCHIPSPMRGLIRRHGPYASMRLAGATASLCAPRRSTSHVVNGLSSSEYNPHAMPLGAGTVSATPRMSSVRPWGAAR